MKNLLITLFAIFIFYNASSQSVGIGVPTPLATLDIARGTANQGTLLLRGTTHWSYFNYSANENTYINGGKNESHIILNGQPLLGNVGIGIGTPLQKLHVFGNTSISDKLGIGISSPNASLEIARGTGSDGTLMIRGTTYPSHFNYATNEDTYIRGGKDGSHVYINDINTLGNVGIGFDDPVNKVDIQGGAVRSGTHATGRPLYITGNIGANINGVEIRHDNGTQGIGFGYNTIYAASTTADQSLGLQAKGSTGSLIFTTNGAERMRIAGNGYVGIGVSDPHAPLQFQNGIANRKIVLYESLNNDHQFYGFGINGGVLRYQVNSTSDNHVFYAGTSDITSNELMRIQGNGNVVVAGSVTSANVTTTGNVTAANANVTGNVDVDGTVQMGYVRVFGPSVDVSGLSFGSASCNCPSGLFAIGGGFAASHNGSEIVQSYPNNDNSWFVQMYNTSLSTHQLQAIAICARMGN